MTDLHPIHVLLVDDHRHIHELVMTVLGEVNDIELVAQASNGQEAVLLCQEHRPDIVLWTLLCPLWMAWKPPKRYARTTQK